MNREQAETFAIKTLGWLVGNDELCPIFLGSTGANIDDLKTQASEPAFLASVLDFVLMDDQWIVSLCDALAVPYDTPLRARQVMPGAEQVHWT